MKKNLKKRLFILIPTAIASLSFLIFCRYYFSFDTFGAIVISLALIVTLLELFVNKYEKKQHEKKLERDKKEKM